MCTSMPLRWAEARIRCRVGLILVVVKLLFESNQVRLLEGFIYPMYCTMRVFIPKSLISPKKLSHWASLQSPLLKSCMKVPVSIFLSEGEGVGGLGCGLGCGLGLGCGVGTIGLLGLGVGSSELLLLQEVDSKAPKMVRNRNNFFISVYSFYKKTFGKKASPKVSLTKTQNSQTQIRR